MTKNYLFYVIYMMLIITLVTFALNVLVLVPPSKGQTYIPQDQVVSVALYHKSQPFILNFSQQKELVQLIDQGLQKNKIEKQNLKSLKSEGPVEKISIQRFRRPPIEIKPIGTMGDKLVFELLDENETLFVVEKEKGSFDHLFKDSVDL